MDGLTQPETTDSSQTGDGDLQRRIVNFLLDRGPANLRRLEVEVRGGVAMVKGQVRTYYEKQLATSCCQRVAGVLQIVNDVEVVERHSQSPVSETHSSTDDSVEQKQ